MVEKLKPASYNDLRKNFLYSLPKINDKFNKNSEFVIENGKIYKKYKVEEVTETYTAKRKYNRFLRNVMMQAVLSSKMKEENKVESAKSRKVVKDVRKTQKSKWGRNESKLNTVGTSIKIVDN